VFDGKKRSPYVESDAPHPLQAYGRSKLEGELGVRAAGGRHAILRTSWIYAHRGRNFVLTMLEKARTQAKLRVVADQHGTPTWAFDIATVAANLLRLAERPEGTFHAAAAGATTWCDFAREILRLAGSATAVEAVSTADYPTPGARPAYTVLDSTLLPRKTGIAAIGDWKERLSAFDQLKVLRDLGRLAEHDRG
jgi:dTDP-4-dehydrorhamnose reductase